MVQKPEEINCMGTESGVCQFHYAAEERRKTLRRDVDQQNAEIAKMENVKKVAYGLTALSSVLLFVVGLNFSFSNETRKESAERDRTINVQIVELGKQVAVLVAVGERTNNVIVNELGILNRSIQKMVD